MKIDADKWVALREAVAADDQELFERLVGEHVCDEVADAKARWQPWQVATSVIDFQGRKFFCFDGK